MSDNAPRPARRYIECHHPMDCCVRPADCDKVGCCLFIGPPGPAPTRAADAAEVERLTSENAKLREALAAFYQFGCPHCGGDCGSANPPVVACPMLAARSALGGAS